MSHNFVIYCVNQSLDESDKLDDEKYGSGEKDYYPKCLYPNVSRSTRSRRLRNS